MSPSASGGCAALATIPSGAATPDIQSLDFDKDTPEYAQFKIRMPKSWDRGTVTFVPVWSHVQTNIGDLVGITGNMTPDETGSVAAGSTRALSGNEGTGGAGALGTGHGLSGVAGTVGAGTVAVGSDIVVYLADDFEGGGTTLLRDRPPQVRWATQNWVGQTGDYTYVTGGEVVSTPLSHTFYCEFSNVAGAAGANYITAVMDITTPDADPEGTPWFYMDFGFTGTFPNVTWVSINFTSSDGTSYDTLSTEVRSPYGTVLSSADVTITPLTKLTDYTIRVDIAGTEQRVYVDNVLLDTRTANLAGSGAHGVLNWFHIESNNLDYYDTTTLWEEMRLRSVSITSLLPTP
jgi:hypothetical protein